MFEFTSLNEYEYDMMKMMMMVYVTLKARHGMWSIGIASAQLKGTLQNNTAERSYM